MAELLATTEKIKPPKVGDTISGSVVNIGSNAVYLDLGALGTGIIFGIELRDGLKTYESLKEGDKLEATVVEIENEDGYVELSLRAATIDKAWEILTEKMKSEQLVSALIIDANKGGLLVELNGINGFLPVSQLSTEHYPRVAEGDRNQILTHLKSFIGKNFDVQVITLDMDKEKLIVSEKAAQREEFSKLMDLLKVGEEVEGTVSGIADFGIFVKFNADKSETEIEGLVHISELAWQRIENPVEVAKVGDKVKAKIVSLENNRISLSIKDLANDPWEKAEKKYKIGGVFKGKAVKIDHLGAFIKLDEEIHGLAHTSQFKDINKSLEVGQTYDFKVIALDAKEHKLGLELEKKKATIKKVVKKKPEKK